MRSLVQIVWEVISVTQEDYSDYWKTCVFRYPYFHQTDASVSLSHLLWCIRACVRVCAHLILCIRFVWNGGPSIQSHTSRTGTEHPLRGHFERSWDGMAFRVDMCDVKSKKYRGGDMCKSLLWFGAWIKNCIFVSFRFQRFQAHMEYPHITFQWDENTIAKKTEYSFE